MRSLQLRIAPSGGDVVQRPEQVAATGNWNGGEAYGRSYSCSYSKLWDNPS